MSKLPAFIGTSSILSGYLSLHLSISSNTGSRSFSMNATTHDEPNYMGVFWWLLALTLLELAVIYVPIHKVAIIVLLVVLAITKAVLVALFFMHLKFERTTLGLIALSPFVVCVFLILIFLPDIYPR